MGPMMMMLTTRISSKYIKSIAEFLTSHNNPYEANKRLGELKTN